MIPNRTFTDPIPLDRTKRVKDARSEAQKEIEDYRKQKENEFKSFEKEAGSTPNMSKYPTCSLTLRNSTPLATKPPKSKQKRTHRSNSTRSSRLGRRPGRRSCRIW